MNASTAHEAPTHPGVVVGFDGSTHSLAALDWACTAAQRHHAPLTVASAYRASAFVTSLSDTPNNGQRPQGAKESADATLDVARVRLEERSYPGEVAYLTVNDDAGGAMVRLSETAEMMVVGQQGVGRFWSKVLGSVSSVLPAHAHCPTVIVTLPDDGERGVGEATRTPVAQSEASETRPITVGVDGSPGARAAALAAADEAVLVDATVHLVLAVAWLSDSPALHLGIEPDPEAHPDTPAHRVLAAEVDWLRQQRPEVHVLGYLASGAPAEAMITLSGSSQLMVLGTRGRGGFTSLLLGSVSRTTLSHARGTVMVIPAAKNAGETE